MTQTVISARVIARKREAEDVVSFRLVSEIDNWKLPAFDAGAHIDVFVEEGITRKYSLCNDPNEIGVYEIAVKLEAGSRGGSQRLHTAIQVGDSLRIGFPQNFFPLRSEAERSVLIAAGIGITPILSMARLLVRGSRPFTLHYFARSRDAAAYANLLQANPFHPYARTYFGLDPQATEVMLKGIVPHDSDESHVYFCGPRMFMDAVKRIAESRLPPERIHCEYFSAASCADTSFEVELVRSNLTLTIPADKSITDVLSHHSVPIETSCEAGVCGSCLTTVLSGTPLHRDSFLSEDVRARNNCLLPCVSRCTSGRLVLDL